MTTGRHMVGRPGQASAYCAGCGVRRTVGSPSPNDSWASRFHSVPLTNEQVDLLLIAAAEYLELCIEAQEIPDPVEFVDWATPDATGRATDHSEFDGVARREGPNHGGGRHSQPFPLPRSAA